MEQRTLQELAAEDYKKYNNDVFGSVKNTITTIFPLLESKDFALYPSEHITYKGNKYHLVSFDDAYFFWVGEYPNFQVYEAKMGLFKTWKRGRRIHRLFELNNMLYLGNDV